MLMLKVLLMRLIDELDPPARGPTLMELAAIKAEEATWPQAAERGDATPALVIVPPPCDEQPGEPTLKRKRDAVADAPAASAEQSPLPPLLVLPAEALPLGDADAALQLITERQTRIELVTRDFRWPCQYDAAVEDASQAGSAAQAKYLRDLFASMHRAKSRGVAGERRRLLAMLELDGLETLQRSVAAERSAAAVDAAIARALPAGLCGDARAAAAVRAKLALLARSQHYLRGEHLLLQLDSLEKTQSMELRGGRFHSGAA
jgi:hypothetical protein